MKSLIQAIDAILPQTQCTQCGYNGCLPYAQAIAQEGEAINRCPPGGDAGIQKLATLLTREVIALDPDCGEHKPLEVAIIEEQHCIGCTLCIQACPVDAIVGANKFMHTVIADLCSGCALCVAPCPVDCIQMIPAEREWTEPDAQAARQRHQQRNARLVQQAHAEEERLNRRSVAAPALGELAVDDASAVSPTPSLSSASNHKSVAKSMRTSNAKHSVDVSQPSLPQQDDEANDTAAKLRNETIAQALARARARRQKPNQS